jgi:glyoxylase-like metal-dependent hydrolase (beta-lactamase superfamily II)
MPDYQVIRISILPFGLVNAHIVKGPNGCILVDAGLPDSEKKIEAVLKANGLNFKDIKLIVITHAHVDHAGSAAKIRTLSGAPIVAHEADLKYYLRQEPMSFCATGWFGNLFIKTGLMFEPYEAFTPDILLGEGQIFDLKPYGLDGTVQHSPGHTAGSISVHLDSRQALVGDLLATGILLGGIMLTDRPKRPPFEDNPVAVAKQLQNLINKGASDFYIGHGGPLTAAAVKAHAESLLKING